MSLNVEQEIECEYVINIRCKNATFSFILLIKCAECAEYEARRVSIFQIPASYVNHFQHFILVRERPARPPSGTENQ